MSELASQEETRRHFVADVMLRLLRQLHSLSISQGLREVAERARQRLAELLETTPPEDVDVDAVVSDALEHARTLAQMNTPTAIHILGESEPRLLTPEQRQAIERESADAIRTALAVLADQEYYQKANDDRQARYVRTVERALKAMVCTRLIAALQGKTIPLAAIMQAAKEFPTAMWLREVAGYLGGDQKTAFLAAHGELLQKYFPSYLQNAGAQAATMTED